MELITFPELDPINQQKRDSSKASELVLEAYCEDLEPSTVTRLKNLAKLANSGSAVHSFMTSTEYVKKLLNKHNKQCAEFHQEQ